MAASTQGKLLTTSSSAISPIPQAGVWNLDADAELATGEYLEDEDFFLDNPAFEFLFRLARPSEVAPPFDDVIYCVVVQYPSMKKVLVANPDLDYVEDENRLRELWNASIACTVSDQLKKISKP